MLSGQAIGRGARYVRRYQGPLTVAGALAVAATLVDLARPWPLLLVVDHALGRRPLGQPWATLLAPVAHSPAGLAAVAGVALVGLAAVSSAVGYLGDFLTDAGAERIGADLRAEIHERLLRLSLGFHQRHRTGDLTTRLTGDVSRVQDALVAWLANLLPQLMTLVGMAIVLVAIDPVMALAALAVVPPLALVMADRRRRLRRAQLGFRTEQGRLAAGAAEMLRNIPLIQASAQEGLAQRAFRSRNLAVAVAGLDVADLNARYEPAADIVLALGMGTVLWFGAERVVAGRMTVGLLVVVLSYVTALYTPIRSLTRLSSILGKGAASRQRLVEVLSSAETVPEPAGAPDLLTPLSEIAFRAVSFAYAAGRPALREVDLRVAAGSTLCVVGQTGAGKSTLLALLLRLYDPDEGRIEIDGRDLRSFTLRSLRERMALVPQDPAIFDGTLLENIARGRAEATDAELREAARLALLGDLAASLPDGYDTQVGEGGAMLSGGQRRCLAIARALVRRAPVMLLDEPTSGLDVESEARVMAVLARAARRCTVVVVTHRLALTAGADRVAVLREGRVVEQGSPGELLDSCGEYARLWQLHRPAASRQRPNGIEVAAADHDPIHAERR